MGLCDKGWQMMRRMAVVAAVAVLGAAATAALEGQATAPAAEKAYAIVLHRPSHVGDKFNDTVKVNSTRKATVTVAGEVVNEATETRTFELSGVVAVTAVNKRGDETGTTTTIERFVKMEGDKATPLLDKGAVVVMTVEDGKRKYALQDGPLPEEARSALDTMHPGKVREDKLTDDDVLGTKEPKKVGQSWPINADAAAREANAAGGMKIESKDVKGTLKLAGVKTIEGKECLEVTGEMTVENVKLGDGVASPPGLSVEKGMLRGTFEGLYPADAAAQALQQKDARVAEMVFGGQVNGKDVGMTVKVERVVESSRRPVK